MPKRQKESPLTANPTCGESSESGSERSFIGGHKLYLEQSSGSSSRTNQVANYKRYDSAISLPLRHTLLTAESQDELRRLSKGWREGRSIADSGWDIVIGNASGGPSSGPATPMLRPEESDDESITSLDLGPGVPDA